MNIGKSRMDYLDLGKGICMILVVWIHCTKNITNPFENLLQSTLMPFYFFLSGMFFKEGDNFKTFLLNKINKLIVPFVFFFITGVLLELIMVQYEYMFKGIDYSVSNLRSYIFDIPFGEKVTFNLTLWFLLCLFEINILFYFMLKLFKKNIFILAASSLLFSFIGYKIGNPHILFIDSAFSVAFFFFIGYFIKNYTSLFKIENKNTNNILAVVSVIILGIISLIAKPFYIGTNEYHNYFFPTFILSTASIISVLLICKKINKISFINYIGNYSIITLGIHMLVIRVFTSLIRDYISIIWIADVLSFIINIICCIIITKFLVKYMPAFVAQKNLITIDFTNKTIKQTEAPKEI